MLKDGRTPADGGPVRSLIAVAVMGLAVYALTASGGPLSKEDYAAAVVSTVSDARIAPGAMNSGSASADGDALARLGDQYGNLAEDLAELEPPPEIAALHAQAVTGLSSQADALRRGAEAVKRGDRDAYISDLARSSAAGSQWTQAFEALAASGYATAPAGY